MADTAEVPEQEVKPESQKSVSETTDTKDESSTEAKDGAKETPTELEQKIIRQIEYYFGDFNIGRDKFMQAKVKENDGWIPLSVLLTFNRLKSLSDDAEVVIKALKKSPNNIVHINDDQSQIRRNPDREIPEFNENWKDEEWNRTVYVKGFPVNSTMDIIMDFMKKEGKVMNIFMKEKFHSQTFKGLAIVTFETADQAETFAKKEGQMYKDRVLVKEMRHDYQTRKQKEYLQRKEDREKRRLEKKIKETEEENEEVEFNFNPEKHMKKDCLMKLTGFVAGIVREDIREKLSPHATIAYVDFGIGDTEAVVRFEESGVAKGVLEKAQTGEEGEKKLIIKDTEISATFPEGDDEVEYWKKLIKSRSHGNFWMPMSEKVELHFNPEKHMKKDCLMKMTGFGSGITREDIKEKLSPHATIAYVDFNIGDTEAVVRFEESGVAKGVLEKAQTGEEGEKKLIIKDAEISATFLEGDDEVEYWKKIIKSRSDGNFWSLKSAKVEFNFIPEKHMKKDCLMKLTGFVEGIAREDIKEKLSPHATIAYVDFNMGDSEAVVRFEESGVAKGVLEKAQTGEEGEKKLIIKDAEISATFLEGDDEVEYWKKIIKSRSQIKNHKRRGGGGYGRGGKFFRGDRGGSRGGWRGGRGRGRGRHDGGMDRNGDFRDSDHKRPAATSERDAPSGKRDKN